MVEETSVCSTCGEYPSELQAALTKAYRNAIVFGLVAILIIAFGIVSIVLIWNSYG